MPNRVNDAEAALHDQTQLLPKKELLVVFSIMATALLVCFVDQNGIGVLLPSIAKDLHAQSTIAWAGTSALIANTVFQVLYGRLSDLFGRKVMLLSALALLSFSDLVCGLAPNATVLYVFRGLAGVANGGITSLSMMIVSDIVTLQQRGKYQGILGTMVGLGNAIGPLIAAGFEEHTTWRGLFYLLAPLVLLAVLASWKFLPSNMPKLNFRETIEKVDFLGLITGTAAVILLLIPISEGGHDGVSWSSPMIISMLTVGGVCGVAFILIEWRFAKLPMMPLSMFRAPSVAVMLIQNVLFGATYYSYLYYIPLYYQNVRGYTPLRSALLQLPLVAAQSIFSILSGQYVSRLNRYGEVIWFGFGIWALGSGLLILCNRTISPGLISFFLVLVGTGTGCVFQPTLVALQAHCSKAQRAVVTSNRNFLRSFGGAVGLAVSSAVLANVLKASLPAHLSSLANNTFATPNLSLYSVEDRNSIIDAYAQASRAVFIWCTPVMCLAFAGCILIKDRGLQRKEEREEKLTPDQDRNETNAPVGDVEKAAATEVAPAEDTLDSKVAYEDVHPATGSIDESRKPSISSQMSEKSKRSGESERAANRQHFTRTLH